MEYRFENIWALWGLFLVLLYLLSCLRRKKHLKDSFLWRKTILNSLALLCCVLGLARPQGGEAITTQVSEQANLFIAVDISQSMLARDTLPSRIKFAIDFTQKLIDQLSQIKIALYPFTLNGYMLMPLSSDLQAAKDLLTSLTPSIATGQGTDLGATLENLLAQIKKSELVAKSRGAEWVTPQVLLLSDGETHVPISDTIAMAFRAASVPIFTVSIGNVTAVPIPIDSRLGNETLLKDRSGKTVLTAAQPQTLSRISDLSGGFGFRDNFQEIPKLAQKLRQSLSIGKLSTSFKLTREFYPLCFFLAFLFLFWDFCFSRWEFAVRALWIPFIICSSSLYGLELSDNESQAVKFYNQGVNAYKREDYKESAVQLEKSILQSLNPSTRKKALFNLGNTFLKMGEIEQALQAYQQSHDTQTPDPEFDRETNQKISDNLVLLQRIKEIQQKKKSEEKKDGQGEGDGTKEGSGNDPKGPKQFEDESLSEQMKRKVLDHISEEEREILKRLAEDKAKKSNLFNTKPW